MFQFPGFPSYTYGFSVWYTALHRVCSHIRKSADITLICSSPQLIAACHVLLRLLMPRHSPYALIRLNFFLFRDIRFSWIAWVSLNIWVSSFFAYRIKRFSFFVLVLSPLGEIFTSRWIVVYPNRKDQSFLDLASRSSLLNLKLIS